MNSYKNLIIVGIIAVIVALGAVGVLALRKTERAPQRNSSSSSTEQPTGSISGSLTYPSEKIPSDLEVHAVNADTGKEYITTNQINDVRYQYGVGYKISVPAGSYYVYGVLKSNPDTKAYHDQFIMCGATVACKDYSKIVVTVRPDQDTLNVVVGDWYNTSTE